MLSTPRISTLNNQKAVVRVVTEEVFFVANVEPAIVTSGVVTEPIVEYPPQIIPVGIVLDVTPQVGQDGLVTLNVHPTISDIVRIETSPNDDTQPVLAVRELDTVGRVRDGETLVIAGLVSRGVAERALRRADPQGPAHPRLPLRPDLVEEDEHRAGDAAHAGDHGGHRGARDGGRGGTVGARTDVARIVAEAGEKSG